MSRIDQSQDESQDNDTLAIMSKESYAITDQDILNV